MVAILGSIIEEADVDFVFIIIGFVADFGKQTSWVAVSIFFVYLVEDVDFEGFHHLGVRGFHLILI